MILHGPVVDGATDLIIWNWNIYNLRPNTSIKQGKVILVLEKDTLVAWTDFSLGEDWTGCYEAWMIAFV